MSLSVNELTTQSSASSFIENGDDEDTVALYVTAVEYTDDEGYPTIHLFGRDSDRQKYHVTVDGHRPHFFVPVEEYNSRVENHHAVYDTHRVDDTSLDGESLVKIETYIPSQVSDLRDLFDNPLEADVFYTDRWLIDTDVYTGVEIPVSSVQDTGDSNTKRASMSVDAIEPCEPPEVQPRVVTVDIEVAAEDGVPDASEALWPISTIVTHDSYTDEYVGWILSHENHPEGPWQLRDVQLDEYRRFTDESDLLHDFNTYIGENSYDIFTAWFGNDFDYPYLINRSKQLSVWSYQQWSPLEEVWSSDRWRPTIKGAVPFDMLKGYEKTKRGEFSKKLDDVADDELNKGKDVVEGSHTEMWKQSPIRFLRYNKIDVQLVNEIADAKDIWTLFRNIRKLTGAQYNDCHNPIDNLDILYLREAAKRNIRLPTATENDRSWFPGAKVFDSSKGVHENVLYFDLASLYPNLIKQLNAGPDTVVGFEQPNGDYRNSYVDDRSVDVKKETTLETDEFYFTDPSNETSFIADVVDEQLSLKEPYRGTDMYIAVKMQVNAQWGYIGDGDSYGTGSRLFDWRIGESITLAGRRVLEFTKEKAIEYFTEMGYDTVYNTHGDTDGCGIAVPDADDREQLIADAHTVAERINDAYVDFVADQFNADENFMEVEVESLASKLFIPSGATTDTPKKRYAQRIVWDDDDHWIDDPSVSVTGLEYVRSDTAGATVKAQKRFVDTVLDPDNTLGDAKEQFYDWLSTYVDEIRSGQHVDDLGRPKGMSQQPHKYGSPSQTPQPTYRGAKYANEYIYEGDELQSGDKPLLYYVSDVGGDYPVTYDSELATAEAGEMVDAIAVNDARDVPREITVDVDKQIEKVLEPSLNRLMSPLGWSFEDALSDTDQTDITTFF